MLMFEIRQQLIVASSHNYVSMKSGCISNSNPFKYLQYHNLKFVQPMFFVVKKVPDKSKDFLSTPPKHGLDCVET